MRSRDAQCNTEESPESPFTVVVFCQGIQTGFNRTTIPYKLCYFLECFMFIRVKNVLQFSIRDKLENTGFDRSVD